MNQGLYDLRLFNEKAKKLSNCRFSRVLLSSPPKFELIGDKEVTDFRRYGPDDDDIDGFVLTLRFFIQDNEKSSFRNLSRLYQELQISQEKKKRFSEARDSLNKYLDSSTEPKIQMKEEVLTNRKILDVFVYGSLAHANPEKKLVYDRWARFGILREMLASVLVGILAEILKRIKSIEELNQEVMNELRT